MAATSVTGIGTGDANKRLAYLSGSLPKLQVTETTTNPQELITTTVSGGGGGDCCECQPWEFIFTRAVNATDPNDSAPVDTGIAFDPAFEWFFGIHLEPYNPTMVLGIITPITDPVLIGLFITNSLTALTNNWVWSPDGGSTIFTDDQGSQLAHLNACAVMPPNLIMFASISLNSNITYDGNGSTAPVGHFTTRFNDSFTNDAYFVILRRPL